MGFFGDLTLIGVSNGMIYAAVALGLVLVWRATHVINFAQGAMATFTTYIAISLLDRSVSYWLAFAAALVAGFIAGGLAERLLVRPLAGRSELQPVVVTIGLLILLESVAGAIWGGGERGFPAAFSLSGLVVGRTTIDFSHFDVFVLVAVVVLSAVILALFRYTDLGLRMRAAALDREVARLLGVRVGPLLSLGWAFASLAGALAGLLVAPRVFLSPANMDSVLVLGFAAAVMGGLESPTGAIVGGLTTGLAISYVTGYLGSSLATVGAAAILIVVLTVRPEGIFARPAARRV